MFSAEALRRAAEKWRAILARVPFARSIDLRIQAVENADEREALRILYASSPLSDWGNYDFSIFQSTAAHAVFLKKTSALPEEIFISYVCRVAYRRIAGRSICRADFRKVARRRTFRAGCDRIARCCFLRANCRIIFCTFIYTPRFAKDPAVDQHRSSGGGIEPRAVEHFFRLACAHEAPFAVQKNLHPSVIIVAMRPARRVNLARGKSAGTQGVDQQCGFLPTATECRAIRIERGNRARVCGAVGHVFGAPVVDFERGALGREILNPRGELRMEKRAAIAERFFVDAQRQHV